MDRRLLLVFIFAVFTVRCENPIASSATKDTTSENDQSVNNQTAEANKATSSPILPSLCTICNCTGDIINCDNKNLTSHFNDTQWPNETIGVLSFEENSIIYLKAFPKLEVRKLILKNNQITKIDDRAFKQLINLTELDLSYNNLSTANLPPTVFEGKFSPDTYEPLAKLTVLNLAHNKLHSLHQDLFEHMSALKVLDLSWNTFSNIDSRTSVALGSLISLEELNLSYCGLKTLPNVQFYSFKVLKKLNLSGNQLMEPPKALEEAETLEYLSLDENPIQIINLKQPMPRMPNLKELSLCCMPHLTVVGDGAFSNLMALRHLRIKNCPKLENLGGYALSFRNATGDEGPEWPLLEKLDLSDNALRYLPDHFVARWDWLKELNLMNNKWSCDCDNQYLVNILLPRYGKKLMGDKVDMLTCAAPPEHFGKNLTSLSNRKLRCLDLNGAQPEKDATILIGVLIGVMLAIPVCLAMFILWRRGFIFCGPQGPASFSRAFYKRAADDDEI